jgi:hypothetical protein
MIDEVSCSYYINKTLQVLTLWPLWISSLVISFNETKVKQAAVVTARIRHIFRYRNQVSIGAKSNAFAQGVCWIPSV